MARNSADGLSNYSTSRQGKFGLRYLQSSGMMLDGGVVVEVVVVVVLGRPAVAPLLRLAADTHSADQSSGNSSKAAIHRNLVMSQTRNTTRSFLFSWCFVSSFSFDCRRPIITVTFFFSKNSDFAKCAVECGVVHFAVEWRGKTKQLILSRVTSPRAHLSGFDGKSLVGTTTTRNDPFL